MHFRKICVHPCPSVVKKSPHAACFAGTLITASSLSAPSPRELLAMTLK